MQLCNCIANFNKRVTHKTPKDFISHSEYLRSRGLETSLSPTDPTVPLSSHPAYPTNEASHPPAQEETPAEHPHPYSVGIILPSAPSVPDQDEDEVRRRLAEELQTPISICQQSETLEVPSPKKRKRTSKLVTPTAAAGRSHRRDIYGFTGEKR
jgi:hypothetical protein